MEIISTLMATHKRDKDSAKEGAYLLRMPSSEDHAIWRRARSRAVLEGRNIRDVIMTLLDAWSHEAGIFAERSKPRRK